MPKIVMLQALPCKLLTNSTVIYFLLIIQVQACCLRGLCFTDDWPAVQCNLYRVAGFAMQAADATCMYIPQAVVNTPGNGLLDRRLASFVTLYKQQNR